jgi:membrane protease YdiL (CAAX protease family)
VRAAISRHPVWTYVVLAYALSWSWWVPMAVRGDVVRPGVGWPTHLPGLAGPAVAAVVVTAFIDGRPGLADLWARVTRWRVGWSWWLLVLGTAALALLGVLVAAVTGERIPTLAEFASYSGIGRIGLAGMVVLAFVVNGVGEETGWRGFAADRLLREHSLTRTSFLVAAVWVGWHVPLFWVSSSFRDFGPAQTAGWAIGLTAGSVVLTWIYRKTGRSILLVAALHTAFNLASATEATGFVVGAIASAVVIFGAVSILRSEQARGGPEGA